MTTSPPRTTRLLGFGLVFTLAAGCPALAQSGVDTASGPTYRTVFSSAKLARTAVDQTGGAISARIRSLLDHDSTPLGYSPGRRVRLFELGNAGDTGSRPFDEKTQEFIDREGLKLIDPPAPAVGLWVDGAWSRMQFEDNGSSYDGDMWSGLVGTDYEFDDRLVVGFASGYGTQSFDSSYLGEPIAGNSLEVAPYVVYRLKKDLSVDVSGGYAGIDYAEAHRGSLSGLGEESLTGASRWFTAVNVNVDRPIDNWRIAGRVGSLIAGQSVDTYSATAVTDDLATAVGDIKLGYVFGVLDGLEPYLAAGGHYAVEDARNADRQLSVGTSLNFGGASLDVRGTSYEALDTVPNYSGMLNLDIKL